MHAPQLHSLSFTVTTRRIFLTATLAMTALASCIAWGAERWPSRPITLITNSAPGGSPDVMARELAARIGMALGQPIVVENVVGANGIIAMERARRAAPDGHTFIFTHIGTIVFNPALFKVLPYDPVRDFDPVSLVMAGPMILAASSTLGIETFGQLLALAQRKPGTLMYGSAGIGSPGHIFFEQIKAANSLTLDHVPFKGAPALMQALMGGQIPLGMEGSSSVLPLIEAGKVRPLAVTGNVRVELLPQVPTFAELGMLDIGLSWLAVMAPKGTLPEAVMAMNRELTRVLALPDLRRSWSALGRQVVGGPPEVLAERIRIELPRWRTVIERADIRPE